MATTVVGKITQLSQHGGVFPPSKGKKDKIACPFCGSNVLDVVWSLVLNSCQVQCLSCGGRGPEAENKENAWKKWQERISS